MEEEDKGRKSQEEANNKEILGKKHQVDSNTKDYDQSTNKKEKIQISQETSNDISHPTVIFNYKGKITFIGCSLKENMKNIFERFAFEIKENKNNLSFKMNNNIIDEKLKYEELVDNGRKNINIMVEEINKININDSENKNYIIAQITVKKSDVNKDLRIINSSEELKTRNIIKGEDHDKVNNEEEIKKCKIEINGIKRPFSFFIKFEETGTFKIKYIFTDNITNTACMFYGCTSLSKIDLSNFNTQNVTNTRAMFFGCFSLTSIDLSNFNTQNVTDMNTMFFCCENLKNIDLSNFNTQNVTNMDAMFG